MRKLLHIRTPQQRRILALSLIVPVLMLAFYALQYGWIPAKNALVEALAGVAAVCLMLQAWKVHKQSLAKAVLFGSASTFFVLASDYYPEEDRFLVFLVMAAPLCLEGFRHRYLKKREKESSDMHIRSAMSFRLTASI